MENEYIEKGLSSKEVNEKIQNGQVNRVKDHTSKSVKEIILANTITLFNAINVIIAILIIFTGEYQNLTFMLVVIRLWVLALPLLSTY